MKKELKKLLAFGIIIGFFTSTYAAFLNTIMRQNLLSDHFVSNWLRLIPKTYLLLLPFILITGPLVRALVERIFRNEKKKQ